MYNVNLLPDYDAFTDSMEDDYTVETRSKEEIKKESDDYAIERHNQIIKAVSNGALAEKEEFTTGGEKPIHVIRYSIKIGKLTYIDLTDDELVLYKSLI